MLPFDIDSVALSVTTHFRNTWLRRWGWDQYDLREALRDAYTVVRVSGTKFELYVRKKGSKKLVVVYDEETNEVRVVTGSEG